MNTQSLPWIFEPCENEGPVCAPDGTPWAHAVRGRKPARPMVIGYGQSERDADHDAHTKAQQADAREVLGQNEAVTKAVTLEDVRREIEAWANGPRKWEVVSPSETMGGLEITPEMWEACQRISDSELIVRAKIGGNPLQCWRIAMAKVEE